MGDDSPRWRSSRADSALRESPTGFSFERDVPSGEGSAGHAFPWETEHYRGQESARRDEDEDGDHGGVGLMEAFESFNLRAEKRVQELLAATDATLFSESSNEPDEGASPPPNALSYVLLSDAYRLARPPQFHHWRQTFPYLIVMGKSSFDEAPDEHIQIRPPPAHASMAVSEEGASGDVKMAVVGRALHLQVDTSDPPQEELILAHGEMEEVLGEHRLEERDEGEDEDEDEDAVYDECGGSLTSDFACSSPRTSRVEETIDQITLDAFLSMVPPLVRTVLERMLRKQQHELRVARERHEEAVRLAHDAEIAARDEQIRRQQREEQERVVYEAAVAKELEEERIQEEERREELRRQQLEENDEEEMNIRTLAYTHVREWYQPKKKCFSHRGRQLTYLKPVLKVQEQAGQTGQLAGELSADEPEETAHASHQILLPKKPSSSSSPRNSRRVRRVSSPCQEDIIHTHRRSQSPQTSPMLSSSRPSSGQPDNTKTSPTSERTGVHLPLLPYIVPVRRSVVGKSLASARRQSAEPFEQAVSPQPAHINSSATVAAPSRVYGTSPYRIPPTIFKNELTRDAVATKRKKRRRKSRGEQEAKRGSN